MKKLILITVSALVLIMVLIAGTAFKDPVKVSSKKSENSITGTWMLDSYKYTSSTVFIKPPVSRQHFKLITDKMFLWSTNNTSTNKTYESAGGTYTLEGDKYTESIDFGYGMDRYLGTKATYTVKVDGDFMFIAGKLADGYVVEEVWIRKK